MSKPLHDLKLTNIHFAKSYFCSLLSTNSLPKVLWARTTYLLGLGSKTDLTTMIWNINHVISMLIPFMQKMTTFL